MHFYTDLIPQQYFRLLYPKQYSLQHIHQTSEFGFQETLCILSCKHLTPRFLFFGGGGSGSRGNPLRGYNFSLCSAPNYFLRQPSCCLILLKINLYKFKTITLNWQDTHISVAVRGMFLGGDVSSFLLHLTTVPLQAHSLGQAMEGRQLFRLFSVERKPKGLNLNQKIIILIRPGGLVQLVS